MCAAGKYPSTGSLLGEHHVASLQAWRSKSLQCHHAGGEERAPAGRHHLQRVAPLLHGEGPCGEPGALLFPGLQALHSHLTSAAGESARQLAARCAWRREGLTRSSMEGDLVLALDRSGSGLSGLCLTELPLGVTGAANVVESDLRAVGPPCQCRSLPALPCSTAPHRGAHLTDALDARLVLLSTSAHSPRADSTRSQPSGTGSSRIERLVLKEGGSGDGRASAESVNSFFAVWGMQLTDSGACGAWLHWGSVLHVSVSSSWDAQVPDECPQEACGVAGGGVGPADPCMAALTTSGCSQEVVSIDRALGRTPAGEAEPSAASLCRVL